MKIYMVREEITYEGWNIVGAYLDKKDAKAAVKALQKANRMADVFFTVEEWEVN